MSVWRCLWSHNNHWRCISVICATCSELNELIHLTWRRSYLNACALIEKLVSECGFCFHSYLMIVLQFNVDSYYDRFCPVTGGFFCINVGIFDFCDLLPDLDIYCDSTSNLSRVYKKLFIELHKALCHIQAQAAISIRVSLRDWYAFSCDSAAYCSTMKLLPRARAQSLPAPRLPPDNLRNI